jgi:hypothetical protein
MHTQTSKTFEPVTDEKLATPSQSPLVPDPHHLLLDLHLHHRLRVGGWVGVEPHADRMGPRPVEPLGIPTLFRLHFWRLADWCGRSDHLAKVPTAQGMGIRGLLFPMVGGCGVTPAGWRCCPNRYVANAAGIRDVRRRVVGAEAGRSSTPECGARAGKPSSRLGCSDWNTPSCVCRFVSDAARGQHHVSQAGT